jgi:hypothetical protein
LIAELLLPGVPFLSSLAERTIHVHDPQPASLEFHIGKIMGAQYDGLAASDMYQMLNLRATGKRVRFHLVKRYSFVDHNGLEQISISHLRADSPVFSNSKMSLKEEKEMAEEGPF